MSAVNSGRYIISDNLIYYIFIILIIIAIITVMLYIKLNKNIKDVNKNSKKTAANLKDIDNNIHNIQDNNNEVIKLHKQINDKSEVMNKMLEQTTKIYRDVLSKESEIVPEDDEIDYHSLNQSGEKPGKHLFEMIDNINGGANSKKEVKRLGFNNLTKDDLNYLSVNELEDLNNQLEEYEIVLKQEFQAYVQEIKRLNELNIIPAKRLKQKEQIYKRMQEIEKKLKHRNDLAQGIVEIKQSKIMDIETKHKEHELDELINNMTNKRL